MILLSYSCNCILVWFNWSHEPRKGQCLNIWKHYYLPSFRSILVFICLQVLQYDWEMWVTHPSIRFHSVTWKVADLSIIVGNLCYEHHSAVLIIHSDSMFSLNLIGSLVFLLTTFREFSVNEEKVEKIDIGLIRTQLRQSSPFNHNCVLSHFCLRTNKNPYPCSRLHRVCGSSS